MGNLPSGGDNPFNAVQRFLYSSNKSLYDDYLLGIKTYDTAQLVANTQVKLCPHKQAVYNVGCPEGTVHKGSLGVTRWSAFPLNYKALMNSFKEVEFKGQQDVMEYESVAEEEGKPIVISWWVNFADPRLFVAYSGRLFAQDEMQVAEHPALAHLAVQLRSDWTKVREAEMKFEKSKDTETPSPEPPKDPVIPLTREGDYPTPILITGIERRVRVHTDANEEEGRPEGLYGNAFGRADISAITAASFEISPPTTTNLICIAALAHGRGAYTKPQIVDLLQTAFTGFKAAYFESVKLVNGGKFVEGEGVVPVKVVVHTGNWGTGAFGGSKPLMAIIQKLAALLAGIDSLVYHTFNEEGTNAYLEGSEYLDSELKKERESSLMLEDLIDTLAAKEFLWGVSDGN